MRKISRFFASFFAIAVMWCVLTPVFAQAESSTQKTPTTKSFALGVDAPPTLWAQFERDGEPRASWPAYWKEACVLTKTSCTESAWRKLPVGFVVTVPLSERELAEALRVRETIAAQKNVVAAELSAIGPDLKDIMIAEARLRSQVEFIGYTLAGLAIFIAIFVIFVLYRSRHPSLKAKEQHATKNTLPDVPPIAVPTTLREKTTPHRDMYLPSDTPYASYPPSHVAPILNESPKQSPPKDIPHIH